MKNEIQEIDKNLQELNYNFIHRESEYVTKFKDIETLKSEKQKNEAIITSFNKSHEIMIKSIESTLSQIPYEEFQDIISLIEEKNKKSKIYILILVASVAILEDESLIMSGSEKGTINVELPGLSSKIFDIFGDKRELLKIMRSKSKDTDDTLKFWDERILNKLSPLMHIISSIDENKLPSKLLKSIYKYVQFWYSEAITFQNIRYLKNSLVSLEENLRYNINYISTFEKKMRELNECKISAKQKKELLMKEVQSTKKNIINAEIGHYRIDQISKSMLELEQVYLKKLKKLKEIEKTLGSDLIIIALNIVYLGLLGLKSRSKLIKNTLSTICSELLKKYNSDKNSSDQMNFNDKWTYDDNYMTKYYKLLLYIFEHSKPNKVKLSKFVNPIEKLNLLEIMVHEYFYQEISDHNKIHHNCFIYTNLMIDPTDSNFLALFSDSQESEINLLFVEEFIEKNKNQILGNKIILGARNLNNVSEVIKKHHLNLLATQKIINMDQINILNAWIDIKLIFLKKFMPEQFKKCMTLIQNFRDSLLKIYKIREEFEALFLFNKNKNKSFFENIALEVYKKIPGIHHEILALNYEIFKKYENIINDSNLLCSFSNIIAILYQSLKQYSNLTNIQIYSWINYLQIIEQITQKLIRDHSRYIEFLFKCFTLSLVKVIPNNSKNMKKN